MSILIRGLGGWDALLIGLADLGVGLLNNISCYDIIFANY